MLTSEDTESEPLQGPALESDSELGQLLNSVGGKGNKAFESALQKLVEQKVQAVLDMTMEKRQSSTLTSDQTGETTDTSENSSRPGMFECHPSSAERSSESLISANVTAEL